MSVMNRRLKTQKIEDLIISQKENTEAFYKKKKKKRNEVLKKGF